MGAGSPVIKLNNDIRCPIIGLDVSQIRIDETANQISLKDIIYQTIVKGIRLIIAEKSNEKIVGEAINQVLNEHRIERNNLFIVTKLEFEEKEDPEKALKDSLERLNLTYFDLYLDHWPSCTNYKEPNKYRLIPVKETWEKMESLV